MNISQQRKNTKIVKFLLSVLILIFFGLANVSHSTQALDELIEGAKKEKELVYYASMNIKEATTMISRFEKKYPFLKVRLYRTGSANILTKILAEVRAKKCFADLIQTLEFSMHFFKNRGILVKYLPIENHYFPKEAKEEGYWTTVYINPYAVLYNKRLVSHENIPKTYDDLLNPIWQGKMMMENTKVDWFAGMLQIMGMEKGLAFMKKLSLQNITYRKGHDLIAQLVAAGEAQMDINLPVSSAIRLKKDGAPIDWVALGPVPGIMIGTGLASSASHPNAAKLYLNFMLSKEGQSLMQSFGRTVMRSDIPRPAETQDLQIVPVNPALAEDLDRYSKLLTEIFSR